MIADLVAPIGIFGMGVPLAVSIMLLPALMELKKLKDEEVLGL